MHYYSTRNRSEEVNFTAAALTGLAPDGGLYVPEQVPQYSGAVKSSLGTMAYTDIAFETIRPWVQPDIPGPVLEEMVHSAYPFTAPLVRAGDRLVLELFHGPTAAFKDFGARFMARAFSYLRRGESKPLKILVATSGDTGGAVADGFYGVEGISVTVLYPKGRVSPLQERQIAGLKGNISALAVEGSFDDCQHLVKQAFGDEELKKRLVLSSANSINISRLIPQVVYYAAASGQAQNTVFSVPSGNFGNLISGLYAWKFGLPVNGYIAAMNANNAFGDFIRGRRFRPRPLINTNSPALDVSIPVNFARLSSFYDEAPAVMRNMVFPASIDENDTIKTMEQVWKHYGILLDPHSAVAFAAARDFVKSEKFPCSHIIVLATGHPAREAALVETSTGQRVSLPEKLELLKKEVDPIALIDPQLDALEGAIASCF